MSLGARALHAVRHDIGRKLTALGLAVGVWFVLEGLVLDEQNEVLDVKEVSSIEAADRERLTANRSTVYLVVPDTLQVLRWVPESMRLRVKGLKEDVRGLVMSAVLEFNETDLEGGDQAAVQRTLGRENFKGRDRSPELTLFRIGRDANATLTVTLVRRTSVSVNLGPGNVSVTGLPAKGYVTDGATARLKPNVVTVSGPQAIVERFGTDPGLLKLKPVSVERRNGPVTQLVGLSQELLDQKVSLSPDDDIEVTVPIVPVDMELKVFALPVSYDNLGALDERGFKLAVPGPKTLDVLLRGPAPDLERYAQDRDALARQIRLVFDFGTAPLVDGTNKPRVDFYRGDLADAVRVFGLDGPDEPRIEFKLEEVPKGP
jgi:hypothetical protein